MANAVNGRNRGTDRGWVLAIVPAMPDGGWRTRLQAAVDASGRSMRDVSLAAGVGANYLHGILRDGKEPTIDRLVAICEQLGVSLVQIVYGAAMTAEAEELLKLYASLEPKRQKDLLRLLGAARDLSE